MANRRWKVEVVTEFLFLGSKITVDGDCSHESWRHLLLGRKAMTNLDSVLKSRNITLPIKVCILKAMVFPVVAYGCEKLDCKEGGAMNNWWLQTMVPEKTPESLLDSKKIKPVNLKGNQPWLLVGRTNADAQKPVFWSSDVYCWLIGKVPDAGKDWGQKEKRVSGDEMAGWHHRCNRHELGQTSGDGEGQRGLACCSPWDRKESDLTGWPNNDNRSQVSHRSWPHSWGGYYTGCE